MYRVSISADFDSESEARIAMADMEEVVGKNNGDLMYSDIENDDGELIEDSGR